MAYFDNKDTMWEATAAFLHPLVADLSMVAAPDDFVNVLPNVLAYDLVKNFMPDFFDFVIVHKGKCIELGKMRLEAWEREYKAVYANPVFVIFAKHSISEISRDSDDFKSLANQLDGLPLEPVIKQENQPGEKGHEPLDYRPVVDFIKKNCSDSGLIIAPQEICMVLPNSMDEQAVLRTSIDTASVAIISVNSALSFPFQDLKSITQNYSPIFSNVFFAIFSRQSLPLEQLASGEFSEVLRTSMNDDDYLITLRRYRDLVLGKIA